MIASDAGASTTVGSSLAREFETWERLTISSSVPPSDSGYAPSGYEWVPQQADGTTRRDHSVPLLGADVDQTAGASGPGEEAPVVPSSSATAGGSASRLLPLPSAAGQAALEAPPPPPQGERHLPQREVPPPPPRGDVVFTQAHLARVPRAPGMGGRTASQ